MADCSCAAWLRRLLCPTPSPSNATSPKSISRATGKASSRLSMNSTGSPKVEALNPRNERPADRTALAEQLDDDFALIQLDTTFVTLLSEIVALTSKYKRKIGALSRQHPENGASDDVITTQKIESVLARLEPVERAIMATPARTIVGLGIKARHAAYVVSEYWDAPIERIDWDARAVRLLIEAICKAAGVRLPFSIEEEL